MPYFQWTQVLLLCALCLVIGYVIAMARWRRRRFDPPQQHSPGETLPRSHQTPATRVLEEQFHAGRLGFEESLELAESYRRQGDIQAAIDIHQSLYGRPGLHWKNMQRAQYELARDFYQAGILGRAEDLLRSLVGQNGMHTEDAVRVLLKIYQQEQDWAAAVDLFERHPSLTAGDLRWEHVHMLCEQADTMAAQQPDRARVMARQAMQVNDKSRRPALLMMQLALRQQRWRELMRLIRDFLNGDQVRLDLLRPLAIEVADRHPEQLPELIRILQRKHDDAQVRLLQGELLYKSGQREQAVGLLESVPLNQDTLSWRLHDVAEQLEDPSLLRLRTELEQIQSSRLRYQCSNCGFESAAHYWHCPQCNRWETLWPADQQKRGKLLI